MLVNYKYVFKDWEEFRNWLTSNGFKRYETGMPCRRGYKNDNIDIEVSYYAHIPNKIKAIGVNTDFLFMQPNEIPQAILNTWVV